MPQAKPKPIVVKPRTNVRLNVNPEEKTGELTLKLTEAQLNSALDGLEPKNLTPMRVISAVSNDEQNIFKASELNKALKEDKSHRVNKLSDLKTLQVRIRDEKGRTYTLQDLERIVREKGIRPQDMKDRPIILEDKSYKLTVDKAGKAEMTVNLTDQQLRQALDAAAEPGEITPLEFLKKLSRNKGNSFKIGDINRRLKEDRTALINNIREAREVKVKPIISMEKTVGSHMSIASKLQLRSPGGWAKDTLFLNPVHQAFGSEYNITSDNIAFARKELDWAVEFNDVIDTDLTKALEILDSPEIRSNPMRRNFIKKKIILQEQLLSKGNNISQKDAMRYRELDNGIHVALLTEAMLGGQCPESIRVGSDNVGSYTELMSNYGWLTEKTPSRDSSRRGIQGINAMANACQVWDDYYSKTVDEASGVPVGLFHSQNTDGNPMTPKQMSTQYRDFAVNSGIVDPLFIDSAITAFKTGADAFWGKYIEAQRWQHRNIGSLTTVVTRAGLRFGGFPREAKYIEKGRK